VVVATVAVAAMMAVGGATASDAIAGPKCVHVSGGLALKGQGSTLQNVAQGEWTSKYNAACASGSNANFSYEGTGSGAALKAFGYESGVAINKTFAYGGTDEAPASAAIAIAKAHANKVAPVIIPVAQTSIAVVANKPAECAVNEGITWEDLDGLFAGTIKHWSELSTITNESACRTAEAGAQITRVVREDGSGTTYQFKNYLSELEGAPISGSGPGKVLLNGTCTAETWSALRPDPTLNLAWPESNCNTGVTSVVRASGGGVVTKVTSTANSIGYAAYPEVLDAGATANVLSLENGNEVGVGRTYALPGQGTGSKEANCGVRSYTVPSTGRKTGGTGLEVDWSTVFGANPEIATSYPLCTLTYELSWNGLRRVGFGPHVGEAVHNYLQYVLGEGQSMLSQVGYQKLPSPAANANNVLGAAELALSKVVESLACTLVSGGLALRGHGSTVQNAVQGEWTATYNAACPSGSNANFSYEGTSSEAALRTFGYFHEWTVDRSYAYVGTEEAPNAAQISIAKEHAQKVAPVIIPVAQTSIAVVANKPAACGLTGGLTWANLNGLFAGKIKHWSELSTITDRSACETAEAGAQITRVVRADTSGTTDQFKNYLSELEKAPIFATRPGRVLIGRVCTESSWDDLEAEPSFNLLWPEAECNPGRSPVVRAEGGGGVVLKVLSTADSIGYAPYPNVVHDAATASALPLQSGNEVGVGPNYALPGQGVEAKEADCGSRTYTVPAAGRESGGTGLEVDWSDVSGSLPEIETAYPLCTLSYDLSWNEYSVIGYRSHIGESIHNYLAYELGEGQSVLSGLGFQKLPNPAANANDVLGAAELALSQVHE
jgi:ABC-type phosphate transport system substrate-binding protein